VTPEVLIFDLFGTLVFFDDTRVPTIEVAGRQIPLTVTGLPALLAEHAPAVDPADFLRQLRSTGLAILEQKRREGIEIHSSVRFERTLLAVGCDAEVARTLARRMAVLHMDTLARAVVCPPGRRELLAGLASSHRLALLSNFDDAATALRVLAAAELTPFFEVIVISDEEGLRKPSRALFERTCERLSAPPGRCLYIGDTIVEDIQGASGAGLTAVWIRRDPAVLPPPEAAGVLSDVEGLPHWLAGRKVNVPGGASR